MKEKTAKGRGWSKRGAMDYHLLAIVGLLLVLGLLMLFEASSYMGQALHNNNGYYYVSQQMSGVVLGLAAMFFLAMVDYQRWRSKGFLAALLFISIILLVLCFIPGIGIKYNSANRWIGIGGSVDANGEFSGRTIQPSEFVKYLFLVFIAGFISYYPQGRISSFRRGIVPLLISTGAIVLLLLLQPNYSMAFLIAISVFAMMVAAGIDRKYIVGILVVGGIAAIVVLFAQTYRSNRIKIFLNPFDNSGYNTNQMQQAYYAIASGGFFGRGLGNSRQKFLFLPQRESDFIMAIIAEEFGLLGCIILIILFGVVIWRGYQIANRCQDVFGSLLATGITTIFGFQVLINMGVGLVALPTTGVTLPFFSFGSSSLLCTLAGMGLLLSISRNTMSVKKQTNLSRSN